MQQTISYWHRHHCAYCSQIEPLHVPMTNQVFNGILVLFNLTQGLVVPLHFIDILSQVLQKHSEFTSSAASQRELPRCYLKSDSLPDSANPQARNSHSRFFCCRTDFPQQGGGGGRWRGFDSGRDERRSNKSYCSQKCSNASLPWQTGLLTLRPTGGWVPGQIT